MNEKHSISDKAKLSFTGRQGERRNMLTEEPSHSLIEKIKTSLKQNKAIQVRVAEAPFLDLKAVPCCKTHTSAHQ